MDETIWIVIGIISVLLVIGILIQFVGQRADDERINTLTQGINGLQKMCESMCDKPEGNFLRTPVSFPSGSIISTTSTNVCGQYKDEIICRNCPCDLHVNNALLNLTGAETFFYTQIYNCFFDRTHTNLIISCSG